MNRSPAPAAQASLPTVAHAEANRPAMLVLDTNYSLEGIRERKIEASITCRDLDGFFRHVWSVHPFATLVTSDKWGPREGPPDTYELSPRHTIIEGRVGRFRFLRRLFPLNFLIGQVELWWKLYRLIRRERIAIIRAASPLYVGLFGLLLARATGAKLVIRVGGNHDKYFEATGKPIEPRLMRTRKIEQEVERFVFPRADLVAGANGDNLDFALDAGARRERSTIFRYGNLIDPRHFVEPDKRQLDHAVLERLGVEPGRFLLYVGRLEIIKQPHAVVRVLAAARATGHDVVAVLAGEGSERASLQALGAELGVAEHLRLPGNQPQDALATLYATTAAIVSPHTGRALTEAALAAAPVAAWDIDWQGEIISDGVTGRIVPFLDVPALADAVNGLLADPAKAKSLGRALRARAQAMLDPDLLDEHERACYRALLSGGTLPPVPA